MRKEIIPVKIAVNKRGARVYFQVMLPADTLYLEGVETGVQGVNGGKLNGNIAGTLQLQAVKTPNLCYQTFVRIANSPVEMEIPGLVNGYYASLVAAMSLPFIGALGRQEPDRIRLTGNSELYGCYLDTMGLPAQKGINALPLPEPKGTFYTVGLYLHIVLKN
ncbi:MAG: hypothetical protein ACHQD8_01355 [Chitinophagales bacterium]